MSIRRFAPILLLLVAVAAGCGQDGTSNRSVTAPPPPPGSPSNPTQPAPSAVVGSYAGRWEVLDGMTVGDATDAEQCAARELESNLRGVRRSLNLDLTPNNAEWIGWAGVIESNLVGCDSGCGGAWWADSVSGEVELEYGLPEGSPFPNAVLAACRLASPLQVSGGTLRFAGTNFGQIESIGELVLTVRREPNVYSQLIVLRVAIDLQRR